ncbi:MAG: peroxiredoxin family protein [Gemmatimonadales bacterium]
MSISMRTCRKLGGGIAIWAVVVGGADLGAQEPRGRWTGTIRYDSLSIDFPLEWAAESGRRVVRLFNGEVPVTSTAVRHQGDSVVVEFAHLATRFEGRLTGGGFRGRYGNERRGFHPVEATPDQAGSARSAGEAPDIDGEWYLPAESAKGERAWRFIVRQQGARVSATILRVDGDAGALTGTWTGTRFELSHFAGTRPARLEVEPRTDGTLALTLRSPRGVARQLEGLRPELARARGLPEPADVTTHTRVRDLNEPFRFSFPDLDGRVVTERDARFAGKVIVVNVTGSWCPNCHDEAPFLADLYRRYRERGLEVVALDFEEAEQLEDLSRLRAFVAKYGIEYPYLVAGEPGEVAAKLPQAVNLNTWPATFFINRAGRVHAVRSGFAAKASGPHHEALVREYIAIVEELLDQ